MTWQEWAFVVLGVVGLGAAVRLVTSKNVVHAALYLVVSLLMVGAIYLLLGAEFLGWVQILIYVGAIVVLLLFGLMLTRAPIGREALDNQQRGLSAIVALGILTSYLFVPFFRVSGDPANVAFWSSPIVSRSTSRWTVRPPSPCTTKAIGISSSRPRQAVTSSTRSRAKAARRHPPE